MDILQKVMSDKIKIQTAKSRLLDVLLDFDDDGKVTQTTINKIRRFLKELEGKAD